MGPDLSFVHRSFQEYFTAAFTVSITGENFHELLDRLSFRHYDFVVEMTRDLNRQMVEQDWIMPTVKKLLDALSLTQHEPSVEIIAFIFMPVVALQNITDGLYWISSESSLLYCHLQAICKLYPSNFVEMQALGYFRHLNGRRLKSLLSEPGSKDRKSYDLLERILKAPEREPNGSPSVVLVQLGEGDDWWLNAIDYGEALKSSKISLEAIRGNLDIKGEKQESMMRLFLSPPTKRKTRTVNWYCNP